MALSAPPPPPPDPPSSSTATATPTSTTTTITASMSNSATTRPLFPRPPPPSHTLPHPHLYHPHPIAATTCLPSHPGPSYPLQLAPKPPAPHPHSHTNTNLLYPVVSSGRGYYHKQPIPISPNPNPNLSVYGALQAVPYHNQRQPGPAFGYDNRGLTDPLSAQLSNGLGFIRPPPNFQHGVVGPSSAGGVGVGVGGGGTMPGVVKGVPVSKIGPNQTPIMDTNGFKEIRDRSRDDSSVVIRDRKVRMSEDASLYGLCRSWMRNGLPEEPQLPYIDVVKSLPRPQPLTSQENHSPGKKEDDKEEEDGGFVEHLSSQDLLQRHIKRAKRVRSRLREERLHRIARYKTRLALLLPPMVEQHFRNDSAAGNGNAL